MGEESPDYSQFQPREASSKRQTIIIVLFAVVTIVLAINFLWPESGSAPQASGSGKERCAANLSRLYQAMAQYAGENDRKYPSRLDQLSAVVKDLPPGAFVCPAPDGAARKSSGANYLYAAARMSHRSPANVVLMYEPLGNHLEPDSDASAGANVLFADGHVKFIPTATMEKVIRELRAGENPPPAATGF